MRRAGGCGLFAAADYGKLVRFGRIGSAISHAPVVFISSTSEDLKEYREQAAAAARAMGFAAEMMEDFPPSAHKPTLEACLEKVE
jgi:hypothetical protein